MLKRVMAIFLLAFMLNATSVMAADRMDDYSVKKGDTLWIISQKYGVKLEDVIFANPQFKDPNMIYPKEIVHVPLVDGKDGYGITGASMCDRGDGRYKTNRVKRSSNANVTAKAQSNSYESQVVTLVNKERAKSGLAPLTQSADISNCARVKSEDMRDASYFSHMSPKFGSPFDMLQSFGISYRTAGENIAKGQKTPEAVMTAWMNSEGHRKNILNANYKEIGVGYVTDSSGTTYWTQQFVTR